LSWEELSTLLDGCFTILNRYSSLYRASTYSRQVVGHDDYKSLLDFIKLGLQKREEEIEKQLQKLKKR